MSTVQNIIDRVKDNLGNRDTGNIGSRTVDVVILDNINSCLIQISRQKKHIAAFEKKVSINVTTSGYEYTIPTVDIVGDTIRIKKILKMYSVRSGETTGYPIERIHPLRRDTLFPLTNTNRVGRPVLYSMYGTTLEFFPFPDASYTVYGRVIIFPATVTNASTSSGIGEEFDDVIEAGATSACFESLQQLDDATYWGNSFKKLLAETLASLDDYPDENWFAGGGSPLVGDMTYNGPEMLSGRTSGYNSALGIQ